MSQHSICLLIALSAAPLVAQETRRTAVVVLRDTEPAFRGDDLARDQAVLLNRNCEIVNTIDHLAVGQMVSYQNTALFDGRKDRLYIVESLRDKISCFGAGGNRIREIDVEDAVAIVLNEGGTRLACNVGPLNKYQTVLFDVNTGQETGRLPIGGLAFVNDPRDELVWAVGAQITGFTFDGEIRIRRPLSRLDAETDYPTVINARNWAATGVAFMFNSSWWARTFWVLERDHPDAKGSKNRLFAVNDKGRVRVLVELHDIDPVSIAIPPRNDAHSVLVVDHASGDVVEFNSDGEFRKRHHLDASLIAASEESGLWIANRKSIRRLNPKTLEVISQHEFETEAQPVGLALR